LAEKRSIHGLLSLAAARALLFFNRRVRYTNMNFLLVKVFILLFISPILFSQDQELPYYEDESSVIRYTGFAQKYSEEHETGCMGGLSADLR
jgi:hypothetical protein